MKNKKNIIITTIVIVFVLSLSIFVIPNTFAIFKSSKSGNLQISTATWNITLTPDSNCGQGGEDCNLNLVSGVTNQTYTLTIGSTSEVDVTYSIELENIPEGVEVALVVPGETKTFVQPDSNDKITFSNAGTILYSQSGGTNTHTLEFKSNLGTTEISNNEIDINVVAQQVM